MSVTPEQLMAYADGELAGVEKALVEAALAEDAKLRATVERHRALRSKLAGAFVPVLDEPVPQRLVDAAKAAPEIEAPAKAPNIIDFATARVKKIGWSTREWGAMAACLMVGLLIGGGGLQKPDPNMLARNGGLYANGKLERALDTQLASDTARTVRIGLTFRDADGDVCRTYAYEGGGVNGLACREGEDWRVQMAVSGEARPASEFRTASVETPQAVLTAVETMIDEDVMNAADERAARDGGWRPQDASRR